MARNSLIGLDLGTSSVKAAQLVRVGDGWVPFAFSKHACLWRTSDEIDSDVLTAGIRSVIAAGEFKGHRAVITAPDTLVDIRPVNVPLAEIIDLRRFIESEIAERHGEVAGHFVADYWTVGETVEHGEAKLQVYSVCISRDAIVSIIQAVEKAGLICDHVEITATALARSVVCESDATTTVLDIGERGSLLMSFSLGGISFCRPIKWGIGHVVRGIKESLDIDMETAQQIMVDCGLAPVVPGQGQ